jgi:hypothetical protein
LFQICSLHQYFKYLYTTMCAWQEGSQPARPAKPSSVDRFGRPDVEGSADAMLGRTGRMAAGAPAAGAGARLLGCCWTKPGKAAAAAEDSIGWALRTPDGDGSHAGREGTGRGTPPEDGTMLRDSDKPAESTRDACFLAQHESVPDASQARSIGGNI